jgi:hypothetical protein
VSLLRKLISPAGFVLALLFFVLPFATVSCDAGTAGRVEASYSGLDLATGSTPPIEATGGLHADNGGPFQDGDAAPDPGVELFAILTAALLVAGVATSAIGLARVRHLAAVGAALAAGLLLFVTENVALSRLKPLVRNVVETQFPDSATLPWSRWCW